MYTIQLFDGDATTPKRLRLRVLHGGLRADGRTREAIN
jgi:hypothetical protein